MDKAIFEDALVFISLIVGMGCLTGIIVTMLKRRAKQVASPETMGVLRDISDRLQRLEGSVDTVAVEIERISEAQRFTTRLLAERATTPALADKAKGVVTPH
ncbi:MAG: hypothetical protein ABJF01_11120 [bacterium]